MSSDAGDKSNVARLRRARSIRATARLAAGTTAPNSLGGRFLLPRLITPFVLFCVVPLVLLSYLTIHLAERAVVREVNTTVQTTSALTAVLLQDHMQAVAALTGLPQMMNTRSGESAG